MLLKWNLVCLTNMSKMFLVQCWRLEISSRHLFLFLILLKWQYSNIWLFLIVDIYHFQLSPIYNFKKMKCWNLDMIGWELEQVAKLERTWNLASVIEIVQKIPDNFCSCLYLSTVQVLWLSELWFNHSE